MSCICTDIDGNGYETIRIGNQVWMAENLKVTHYRDGKAIKHIKNRIKWMKTKKGAWCYPSGNAENFSPYGLLYNWHAVNNRRGLAPEGWHIPSDEEWKQLEINLGMSLSDANDEYWRGTNEGGKLKELGISHWSDPNVGADDTYGFCALPAGGRTSYSGEFKCSSDTIEASFWSSTSTMQYHEENSAWIRYLTHRYSKIGRHPFTKNFGFSVRCIKD